MATTKSSALNGVPVLPTSVRLTTTSRTDIYTNGLPLFLAPAAKLTATAASGNALTVTVAALFMG